VNVFARLCLVLGGLFVADAVIFWSLQHEHVGTSLIAMTAVGFAFLGLYAATSLRKARRGVRREEEPPESAEPQRDSRPAYAELGELAEELPRKERAAVVLRYGYDLSYAAIGAALGSSEDAARQAASSGVRRLRRRMQ
jgi:arginine exporter protein ArgO